MLKIEQNLKILEEFEKYLIEAKKSSNTVKAYVKDIKDLIFFLSPKKIQSLQSLDLLNFKKQIEKDQVAAKTLSRKLNSISKFTKFLIREKHIKTNPFKVSLYPELEDRKIRALNKEECEKLYETAKSMGEKYFVLISILLFAGLKISEARNLCVGDIKLDMNKGFIRIKAIKADREVPLCEKLFFILSNYIHQNNLLKKLDKALLCTSTGKNYNVRNLRGLVDKVLYSANIYGFSANDIRNTFIVKQLEEGNTVEFVSKVSGLNSRLSMKTYLELISEYLDKGKELVVSVV